MANVKEGITFDLEKNAQVNQLISSYDPKLRLREKILFQKMFGNKMHITYNLNFFWPIIKKVGFLLFPLINLSKCVIFFL